MFIGRNREIKSLAEHFATGRPSFVVVKGRRRIGKSTLIQEFAKRATEFYEFQGLAPREQMNNSDQLDAFSKQLAKQSKLPQLHIRHWSEAFSLLASVISDQPTVVLLDEISWMARHDRDFAGQLKVAWDTEFKKKPNLMHCL